MNRNRLIGFKGGLPWRISADLKRFRKITYGHTIVMGRKTYDSLPKKPLDGRRNIVLTTDVERKSTDPNLIFVHSFSSCMDLLALDSENFIIGGESVYSMFMPVVSKMYLTLVESHQHGDAYFPLYSDAEWTESEPVVHCWDHDPQYSYMVLNRCV